MPKTLNRKPPQDNHTAAPKTEVERVMSWQHIDLIPKGKGFRLLAPNQWGINETQALLVVPLTDSDKAKMAISTGRDGDRIRHARVNTFTRTLEKKIAARTGSFPGRLPFQIGGAAR